MSRKLTWKEKMEEQLATALNDPASSFFDPATLADRDDAFEATIAHLRNPSDSVRYNAIEALERRFNLSGGGTFFCRYRVLVVLNMCQLPTPLIEGSEGLEAIFRGLERGDSRKNIGLEYTPRPNAGKLQDILDNLNAVTPFPPLPIEAMKRLEGGDAEWLRAQLFSRMNDEGRSSFYYRYRRVITEELNPVLHTPLTVAQREARGLENDEDAICVRVGSRWIPTLIAVKPAGWRTILDEEEKLAIERSKQSIDANDDPAYENDWLQELRGFLKELD